MPFLLPRIVVIVVGFCFNMGFLRIFFESHPNACIQTHTNNRFTLCRAVTLLLRGANDYMLDEVDRALHDALCIVKRVLENRSVVPGGGAVEAGLSIYLENFASALGSREQLAINEFAEALLVVPKTLAVNAAKDATDLVAKLRALHNIAQKQEEKKYLSSVCFLCCSSGSRAMLSLASGIDIAFTRHAAFQ